MTSECQLVLSFSPLIPFLPPSVLGDATILHHRFYALPSLDVQGRVST
jgi:hypothetical protein